MPVCCRCNASGKCLSCKCAKGKSQCYDYLPGRLGNCTNPVNPWSTQATQSTQRIQASLNPATSQRIKPTQPLQSRCQERVTRAVGDACPMLPKPEELPKEPIYWSDGIVSDNIDPRRHSMCIWWSRWKHNLVPTGKVEDSFMSELSHFYRTYGESTMMEFIALMAAMTMPALLLQKPFARSKMKDHIWCLEKRMDLWREGKYLSLCLNVDVSSSDWM